MKYSIIIPTYNHCDDLLKPCVDSILKYSNLYDIELIISANGCTDNTRTYLNELKSNFSALQLENHLKIVWEDNASGYAKACNDGIKIASTDLIVLLNNDVILLGQTRNYWLEKLEESFTKNNKCGISCLSKLTSEITNYEFAIFFCVMIHRKVFEKIGLLSLDYGPGAGEDTEFSAETIKAGFDIEECVSKKFSAELGTYVGNFPLYHKGEGTVHDRSLVSQWDENIQRNRLTLGRKYNPGWYQWSLSNHTERAVYFKNDKLDPCTEAKYIWAANNRLGKKILDVGCSSGFLSKYFLDCEYTGIDYDEHIIRAAHEQSWDGSPKFIQCDINNCELEYFDTIIALDVIFQIEQGLDIIKKLKNHCDRLLITVPYRETKNMGGLHRKLFDLNENDFPEFEFKLIRPDGVIIDLQNFPNYDYRFHLLACCWDKNK